MLEKWAKTPFDNFMEYCTEEIKILDLCIDLFSRMPAITNIVKVVNEDINYQIKSMEKQTEFAISEMDGGFPRLHSHTLVVMWGALETLILELMVAYIQNVPAITMEDDFKKVQVPLTEFETMDKEERARYIVSWFEQDHKVSMKPGIIRFESLLEKIGLQEEIEPLLKKTLLEIGYVRNVIVHKSSIVDDKFLQACPWTDYKIKDKIQISKKVFGKYFLAITDYVFLLVNRVKINLGEKPYCGDNGHFCIKRALE